MIRVLLIFTICLLSTNSNSQASMKGISIGDSINVLSGLNLEVSGVDMENITPMISFTTENGNYLAVTFKDDKVVYLENDWLQDSTGNVPLATKFIFGESSLKEIRASFNSNGFAYVERSISLEENQLLDFTCYEIDSSQNEILVIVTKTILSEALTKDNLTENLKLVAVILAEKSYRDEIWGKEKTYSENNKQINI